MLKEIQGEGVVDIGADKNFIKDKRKNNLKEKKLHNTFFQQHGIQRCNKLGLVEKRGSEEGH